MTVFDMCRKTYRHTHTYTHRNSKQWSINQDVDRAICKQMLLNSVRSKCFKSEIWQWFWWNICNHSYVKNKSNGKMSKNEQIDLVGKHCKVINERVSPSWTISPESWAFYVEIGALKNGCIQGGHLVWLGSDELSSLNFDWILIISVGLRSWAFVSVCM